LRALNWNAMSSCWKLFVSVGELPVCLQPGALIRKRLFVLFEASLTRILHREGFRTRELLDHREAASGRVSIFIAPCV
jgi:hypothetical protein